MWYNYAENKEKTEVVIMYTKTIQGQTMDWERALYGSAGLEAVDCRFDGPADGESAFKECRDIRAKGCFFNLRYPFWHDLGLEMEDCLLTPQCRAALWYSSAITIRNSRLHGIKALRECSDAVLEDCDVESEEFGWFSRGLRLRRVALRGAYCMLQCRDLGLEDVTLKGKYSFQYIRDAEFDGCEFDTKDAFWHAENVVVRNSTLKGEYLAWYCKNVTFENCTIQGTQPLCYCQGLKLINCRMVDTDLAFERSQVEATVTTPILSIKNPRQGHITAPAIAQQIWDDPQANAQVTVTG